MSSFPSAEERLATKLEQYTHLQSLITRLLQRDTTKGAFNGREYTLHDVHELVKLRDKLERELSGQGAMRVRAIVPRG